MQEYYPLLVWVILGTVVSIAGFFFALKERKEGQLKRMREQEDQRRQSEFDFSRKDKAHRTA